MENSLENRIKFLKTQRNKPVVFYRFNNLVLNKTQSVQGKLLSITKFGACRIAVEFNNTIDIVRIVRATVEDNNVRALKNNITKLTHNEYEVLGKIITNNIGSPNTLIHYGKSAVLDVQLGVHLNSTSLSYRNILLKIIGWLNKENYIFDGWNDYYTETLLDYNWMTYSK